MLRRYRDKGVFSTPLKLRGVSNGLNIGYQQMLRQMLRPFDRGLTCDQFSYSLRDPREEKNEGKLA